MFRVASVSRGFLGSSWSTPGRAGSLRISELLASCLGVLRLRVDVVSTTFPLQRGVFRRISIFSYPLHGIGLILKINSVSVLSSMSM